MPHVADRLALEKCREEELESISDCIDDLSLVNLPLSHSLNT